MRCCRYKRRHALGCPRACLFPPDLDRRIQEAHTKTQPSRGDLWHTQRTKVSASPHPDDHASETVVYRRGVERRPLGEVIYEPRIVELFTVLEGPHSIVLVPPHLTGKIHKIDLVNN